MAQGVLGVPKSIAHHSPACTDRVLSSACPVQDMSEKLCPSAPMALYSMQPQGSLSRSTTLTVNAAMKPETMLILCIVRSQSAMRSAILLLHHACHQHSCQTRSTSAARDDLCSHFGSRFCSEGKPLQSGQLKTTVAVPLCSHWCSKTIIAVSLAATPAARGRLCSRCSYGTHCDVAQEALLSGPPQHHTHSSLLVALINKCNCLPATLQAAFVTSLPSTTAAGSRSCRIATTSCTE
eukprot:1160603-Pelagomonas_calceolata.AAC.8